MKVTQLKLGLLLAILVSLVGLPVTSAEEITRITVVSDVGSSIILDYKIPEYHSKIVQIEDEEFMQIEVPGEPVSMEKGAPALPHINRSIIIPDDARMMVKVVSASYEETSSNVIPSKGPLPRTIDPDLVPYEFGESYEINAFYPGTIATLGVPYIMRDHRGIVVQVNPFQYNPVTKTLRIYTQIVLEVTAVGPGQKNVLKRGDQIRARVRAFENIYQSQFLNYESHAENTYTENAYYDSLNEVGDMLIITHDPWIENLDTFVSHKSSMNIPATVVSISTIGNDAASIKNYIQNVYDTSDLAFVLLVGDAAEVATPLRQVGWENGASDPSYAKLAGDDDYPEIIVGRFSAQTAAELDTQLQRTMDYEMMPANEMDWFRRGTGIASAEGTGQGDEGQSDKQHIDEIRTWLLNDGYSLVDQIYDPGATDTMVTNAVNNGRGIINYCGHGSPTSWGTTSFNVADVDALTNDNMLPFIISVACNNGEFHNYSKCFAEAWLRATNNSSGEPTGAIGMYASSVSQSWAPPMEGQDEFNLLLTDPTEPYFSYGAMCFAGSCSMMDNYGSAGVEMFDTWIIFGDPSLRIIGSAGEPKHGLSVAPEDGLVASGQAGGPYNQESIEYTLRNHDNTPMDYEVTKTAPWIMVTNPTGTISARGSTKVTVSLNDLSRNFNNGNYADVVHFVNLTNHDGDTTRPVSLTVGIVMTLGQWMFDIDPGWSCEGEWEFGMPTGNGGTKDLNPDPTSGATGSNVYGANLDGNISKFVGGPYCMTVGPLDFTGCINVTLLFQRWLNTVGPPKVSSTVEVSNGGSTWTSIWSSSGMVADNAWLAQALDISAIADGGASVYVRWGYQINEKLPRTGSGWNIDDIMLEGLPDTARITLTLDKDHLYWTSVAGAIAYDIVRGDIDILRNSGGDFTSATDLCLGDNLEDTQIDYTEIPTPGNGHWFLIRGVSTAGPMTYQALSGIQVGLRDDEINAAGESCL